MAHKTMEKDCRVHSCPETDTRRSQDIGYSQSALS